MNLDVITFNHSYQLLNKVFQISDISGKTILPQGVLGSLCDFFIFLIFPIEALKEKIY